MKRQQGGNGYKDPTWRVQPCRELIKHALKEVSAEGESVTGAGNAMRHTPRPDFTKDCGRCDACDGKTCGFYFLRVVCFVSPGMDFMAGRRLSRVRCV